MFFLHIFQYKECIFEVRTERGTRLKFPLSTSKDKCIPQPQTAFETVWTIDKEFITVKYKVTHGLRGLYHGKVNCDL